ncbi:Hypothetical protein, putative [Bodo saltans]|uniref:Uncharacterized protein n=1 Tax=Bodo saltans TaxID=75058 RepID=A0A0S4IZX8_BODSA|nr:Hypothetical protein, putative [Bodo saltans]|eukprot:CUG05875.1 Hypothetical protein, putative [Bodo saltans]
MLTAKSAERQRHQRGDYFTNSTYLLLRDHTVLELASQRVPICAPTNINPCTVIPRRLPRLAHGGRATSPTTRKTRSSSHCSAVSVKAKGGVRGTAAAITAVDSYQTYHQLQCPVCRAASSATYFVQNRATFVEERAGRDLISGNEGDERALFFRAFKIGIAAIEKALRGPVAVIVPPTTLPRDVYEDLASCETGERLDLAKVLWRQLRSLHFSADALLKHCTTSSVGSHPSNSTALVIPTQPSPSRRSLAHKLQVMVEQVEAAMDTLAPVQDSLRNTHYAERRGLNADERDQRLCIESEYTTVMSVVEVSASAWRASASKSLAQRKLQEQVQEQQRHIGLESKTREFLVKDELVAWTSIMNLVREHTGAFRLQLIQQSITALLSKEEKIRLDRCAACTVERDAMFHRALFGLEEGERRDHSETAHSGQVSMLHEHKDWVAARSPEDLEDCRVWHSRRTVDGAVSSAVDQQQPLCSQQEV